ncbi:MAG: chorismate-binding protein [Magnetococcales bacterium]|nr:chorismate-binding protein [Magnetococcales bacterium]
MAFPEPVATVPSRRDAPRARWRQELDRRLAAPGWHATPERLQAEVALLIDFPELGAPWYFAEPERVLTAHRPDEVRPAIREAERAARSGCWVAAALTYEAASAFGLPVCAPDPELPLAWFALFPQGPRHALYAPPDRPDLPRAIITPGISRDRFDADLEAIAAWIRAGDSYQVNYTLPAALSSETDLASLFLRLQSAHRFPRAIWLQAESWSAASLSPELFLERQGERLITAPIKGTRPRSPEAEPDRLLAETLEQSIKDRAEHIMIVDMARNDLGQICRTGTVQVERLAACRSFSTVHHLETRVHGEAVAGVTLEQVLEATFPPASITGAPKRRTMEMIRALERRPRGLYTGMMGLLAPGGDGWLNVAIRTVVETPAQGRRIGVGGGVVSDSCTGEEWAEVATKARFLTTLPEPLTLLETFRVEASGEVLWLDRHLARMSASARALGFPLDPAEAERLLRATTRIWADQGMTPVTGRLALALDGGLQVTHRPLLPWPEGVAGRIARWRPDPQDPLARHKSNRRLHADAELRQAREAGYHEVIFINRAGRVTEGAISALLVRLEGRWLAPSLEEGLCPSLWRAHEMARLGAVTAPLSLEELRRAEEIRIGNAVRGGTRLSRLDDADGAPLQLQSENAP